MTREKAIEMCKSIKDYLTGGNPVWSKEEVAEAMTMAIEALTHDKHTETHDVRLDFKSGELFLTLNEAVKVAVNQFDVDPVIARQEFEQKCYIPCSDYEKGFYDGLAKCRDIIEDAMSGDWNERRNDETD